jgi:UDP-N-acetylmuramate dehydrogenase
VTSGARASAAMARASAAMAATAPASAVPAYWAPTADPVLVAETIARIRAGGVAVERDRLLGPLTTFGIGGPAAGFVEPTDRAALAVVQRALVGTGDDEVPVLVLGRGSNVLISDAGFPGLVLRLGRGFKEIRRVAGGTPAGPGVDGAGVALAGVDGAGVDVDAGAAVAMPALAAWAAKESLGGLEFGAGIPGSVGGCVRMNAGAHGGQVADRLLTAELMPIGGEVRVEPGSALGFGYRHSALPPRAVVTGARFRLVSDDPARIRARLDDLRTWRRATQPLRERNCGSVFTNPDGDSAGRLVEAAGCMGQRRGGARVSDKHANFIVVSPGTGAQDVLDLITQVRAEVAANGGPWLVPEVRVVGRFAAQPAASVRASAR